MQLLVCLSPSWQADVLVDQKAWVLVYADFFLWNINVDCLFVLPLHGKEQHEHSSKHLVLCSTEKKESNKIILGELVIDCQFFYFYFTLENYYAFYLSIFLRCSKDIKQAWMDIDPICSSQIC